MNQDAYNALRKQWDKVRSFLAIDDIAFIFLRIIILLGGIGWLIFSHVPQRIFYNVSYLFIAFVIYSVFIFVWLFVFPNRKGLIYECSLIFDLVFTLFLVKATGGFDSHFLNGFYLVTALYSFHYGLSAGAVIAAAASVLYLVSGSFHFDVHHWADYSVRIAFLFLVAIPLGLLSQKLRRDRDTIKSLNENLSRYIEELQNVHGRLIQVEKLSELGRLSADIAHEIRNPLTSIGGFARRLDKKLLQASNIKECASIMLKEKEYSEIIISEVSRLERILSDVLTFSREKKAILEFQGINEIVKESLQTFIDVCDEQSILIKQNFDVTLPEILIDRDQVRLAVNNLISNAIDAMSEGGTLQVNTRMKELNAVHYVAADVVDTGHGIPRDKLSMIFEPFYSSKEIGSGTGLGLSLSKKIVDEHHGLLFVESELEKGTTFEILFPYQPGEDAKKTQCWEFTHCGVEKTEGAGVVRCPAYPHYGRICWAIAGTFCGTSVSGAMAQKLGDCNKCDFYQKVVLLKEI